MRALELDLDVYQGPFDLLLSLVFKEEIDLLEVPLFEVISAYLDELEAKGATADWDEMSEFLLLMSLLVEIKSRLLLPGAEPGLEAELTPEQARDQLLARLFEYSKFKAAAGRLRELGGAERGLSAPPAGAGAEPAAASARRDSGQRRRHAAARGHDEGAGEPAGARHRRISSRPKSSSSARSASSGASSPGGASSPSTASSAESNPWCRRCRFSPCSTCWLGVR